MDFMAGHTIPLEARMLLNMLKGAAAQQANQGRSVLLSTNICQTIVNYLERQTTQTEALQDDIRHKQQALEQLRTQAEAEIRQRQCTVSNLQAQVAHLQASAAKSLAELQEQMRAKEDAWNKHKHDLETQLADIQQRYRRKTAARSFPNQELAQKVKFLETDNRRLVMLLSQVPQLLALATELWSDSDIHYMPLEDCLQERGVVEEVYTPLMDRPMAGAAAPGASGSEDPSADPSGGANLVLDEQYHWVPREALQAGTALMRRLMPTLPTSQLMGLVAELNKVWRDREHKRLAEVAASHQQELQHLRETFEQSLMNSDAFVPGQGKTELKRRMAQIAAARAEALAAAKGEKRRLGDNTADALQTPTTASGMDVPDGGLTNIQELSRQVTRLEGRNKKLAVKLARQARAVAGTTKEPLCRYCINWALSSAPSSALITVAPRILDKSAPTSDTAPAPAATTTVATARILQDVDVTMSTAADDPPTRRSPEVSFGGFLEDPSAGNGSINPHTAPPANGEQPHSNKSNQAWSTGTTMPSAAAQARPLRAPEAAAAASGLSEEQGGPQTLPQPFAARTLVRVNVFPTTALPSSAEADDASGPSQPKTTAAPTSVSFADRLAATLSGLSIRGSWDAGAGPSGSGGGKGSSTIKKLEKEQRAGSLAEWLSQLPPGPSDSDRWGIGKAQGATASLLRSSMPAGLGAAAAGTSNGCGQPPIAPVRVSVRFPRQDGGPV